MKQHLIIVACLMLSSFLFCQEKKAIKGQVTDKDSKYPIVGASVVLIGSNPPLGTLTDENGYFKLEVPLGRVSIKVSYMGYKDGGASDVLVVAGKETQINIEIEEMVSEIKEVVVTGNKDLGRAKNEFAAVSARSFDVELTSRFSGNRNDPSRMASNFAGVSGANDARNDIIIRGNSPMGMLWRLEGINIPSPNHFGGFGSTGGPVSMLNNNTLARGDFLTAAFPAEYGNALSGVFDLTMRSGNKDKHEFLVQLGFNGIEVGAEGPFHKKKSQASFILNYRYSTLALFKLLRANFGTGTAVPQYQDLSFKIDIPTKKAGIFRFWGLGGLSAIELLGSKVDLAKNPNNLYGNENQDIYNRVRTGVVGFSHTYFISKKSYYKLNLAVSHQGQFADIDSVSIANRTDIVRVNKVALMQSKISSHILYNNKFNAKNVMTTGIIADVFNLNLSDSVRVNSNLFAAAKSGKGWSSLLEAYTMWQHKFSTQLSLNTGFHVQYFTLSGNIAPEPRIGLKYQFKENQFISIGYGLHHQIQPLPTYYNQDLTNGADKKTTNLQMGFSRSQHIVAGYDLVFYKTFHLKTEAYFQYIDKVPIEQFKSSFSMLNAGADFATPNNNYLINKGLGYNYGLEITMEKFFSQGYYFLLTGSLFQSKYKGGDNVWRNTAFNGLYVVNALGGYEYRFGGKKDKTKRHIVAADMKMTAAGGRYYTPIDVQASEIARTQILIDSLAFTQKYQDYFRIDLKVSYRISMKRVTQEFSTDFQNLANIQNIFRKVYNPRTNSLNNEYQQGLFILPQYRLLF